MYARVAHVKVRYDWGTMSVDFADGVTFSGVQTDFVKPSPATRLPNLTRSQPVTPREPLSARSPPERDFATSSSLKQIPPWKTVRMSAIDSDERRVEKIAKNLKREKEKALLAELHRTREDADNERSLLVQSIRALREELSAQQLLPAQLEAALAAAKAELLVLLGGGAGKPYWWPTLAGWPPPSVDPRPAEYDAISGEGTLVAVPGTRRPAPTERLRAARRSAATGTPRATRRTTIAHTRKKGQI